jgi:colanic acid biosynthesis glycosyl transferase WcaI
MKILIYGLNYAPELTGAGKYTAEMAEALAARGHDVRVVCAPPYYPEWKVADGFSWWRGRRETLRGVEVARAPLWVPKRPNGVKRLMHLASFAAASLPALVSHARWRPQVVMTIAPSLLNAPAALALSFVTRANSLPRSNSACSRANGRGVRRSRSSDGSCGVSRSSRRFPTRWWSAPSARA